MPDHIPTPGNPLNIERNWLVLAEIAEQERRDESYAVIRKVCKQIRKDFPEIKELRFPYSGGGDQGDWVDNGINQFDDKRMIEAFDAIQNVLDPFLPGGYENNDGGEGDIVLNVETCAITCEHADFETTVERIEQPPVTYRPPVEKERKNGDPVSPRRVKRKKVRG